MANVISSARHYLLGAHVWAYYPLIGFGQKGLVLLNYKGQDSGAFVFESRTTKAIYKYTLAQIIAQSQRLKPFCIRTDIKEWDVCL